MTVQQHIFFIIDERPSTGKSFFLEISSSHHRIVYLVVPIVISFFCHSRTPLEIKARKTITPPKIFFARGSGKMFEQFLFLPSHKNPTRRPRRSVFRIKYNQRKMKIDFCRVSCLLIAHCCITFCLVFVFSRFI